jgi:hypothetical protein
MRIRRVVGISVLVVGSLALVASSTPAVAVARPASTGAPAVTNWYRLPARHGATRSMWSSSNWSGYAETGHFTTISGNWTVPGATAGAADSSSTWFSSAWLGIDGFNNSQLIQTGTEQDFYGGSAHYSAWWEILPKAETVIPDPVSAGDVMTAAIVQTATPKGKRSKVVTNRWSIRLQDVTKGWTFTTIEKYKGLGESAEFIVEAPVVGRSVATISHYSFLPGASVNGDFNSAGLATTIGGAVAGARLNFVNDAGTLIQNGVQVSTPGAPDAAATAFNSAYGANQPAAPAK